MFLRILVLIGLLTPAAYAEERPNLTWEQQREQYEFPAWYTEARLGIWAHWGAQTQPEQGGGWYARHMYMPDVGRETWGAAAYPYHVKTYGHPSEKGFKDVIHEWKADQLDTDALMKYFKSLGAKYFVVLANHHDHFDNFDSTHHPWNSVNVGPQRDIVREFEQSAKKFGMPFGVSSHDDRFLRWWLPAFEADKTGPKKGIPYDGRMTKADGKGQWWEGLDPADLYGLPPEQRTPEYLEQIGKNYQLRHQELVTKYDVDLLWFDGHGFPYGKYGEEVCRTLYNNSLRKHGKITAVVAGKFKNEPSTAKDIERGGATEILDVPWQGTMTFNSWFYKGDGVTNERPLRHNARTVIEMLIDINSKNGNLLLNVELLPDGRVPADHKAILDEIGQWVNLNAEAIYASKPWKVYGDNLNSIQKRLAQEAVSEADLAAIQKKGNHFNERTIDSPLYGHDEVRFTTKGDLLYVFVLNPLAGKISLPSLGMKSPQQPGAVRSVRLIGSEESIDFDQNCDALELTVPEQRPTKYAAVFEVRV